jgi:hypothetical protein
MTTFKQLDEEWEKDSYIDYDGDLGQEIIRSARLHQKWLRYFNEFRIKYHEQDKKVKRMDGIRRRYHRGELLRHELEEYGWEPYNLPKPTTNAASDKMIESDPVMIELHDKLFMYKLCADTCESIIWKIRDRSNDIRTALDWRKFEAGN